MTTSRLFLVLNFARVAGRIAYSGRRSVSGPADASRPGPPPHKPSLLPRFLRVEFAGGTLMPI